MGGTNSTADSAGTGGSCDFGVDLVNTRFDDGPGGGRLPEQQTPFKHRLFFPMVLRLTRVFPQPRHKRTFRRKAGSEASIAKNDTDVFGEEASHAELLDDRAGANI